MIGRIYFDDNFVPKYFLAVNFSNVWLGVFLWINFPRIGLTLILEFKY